MTRQFKRLDIEFETLDATDWRNLTKHDYENVDRETRDKQGRRPLSPGMIACHLSHRRAIATVASGQHPLTAIFEDDVTLTPNIAYVLQSLQRAYSLGVNFDIVFLHRIKTYRQYKVLRSIDDQVKLGVTKYSDRGALAYLISKNAAVQLLKRCPKVVHQLDHTLHAYWESGLSVFSLEHPVVMHGNEAGSHSFLQESRGDKRSWSVQRLPHRFMSILREEILKRRFFRRKLINTANTK
jgi:glycosyl transferase family 25